MDLFRFANIGYLWGLLVIPVLAFLFVLTRISRKKALRDFGNPVLLKQLMPYASASRPILKFVILMAATAFIIIAIARPQYGSKLKKEKTKGIEMMIALDVSNSMLAEDIQPSRLERAKRAIAQLVDKLKNDKVGLVVFAGDAYVQLPMTSDYSAAKLFLTSVNPQMVPKQGTAVGAAINLCVNSFTPKGEMNKAIIVITDGENHEDDAVAAAREAAEKKIFVHTIGMGLPQGSPIPINKSGQTDYLKDKDGKVVITKLDEKTLEEVATAGKGIYVRANNSQVGLNAIFDEINKMSKEEMETVNFSEYNDQYQVFLLLALLFIILEFAILERKNKYLKEINLFAVKNNNFTKIALLILAIGISSASHAQNERKYIRSGNKAYMTAIKDTSKYDSLKFVKAEDEYRKALSKRPTDPKWNFNLADAVYKQKRFDEAAGKFSELTKSLPTREEKARALHNLGNSQLMQQKIDESIESYKSALRKNPNDLETKYNLAYAQLMKKQQQQQQQQQQKQQQDQNKDQKQDQNKDNKDNKDQQQKQEQQQNKISKQNAEQLLQALQNDERNIQEKVKKEKAMQMKKATTEKDW